jgi:hypothetical protein
MPSNAAAGWNAYALDLTNAPDSTRERFWSKVDIGRPDHCWTWLAFKTPLGYGRFSLSTATPRVLKAPRVAYALTKGPIPQDITIDHLCDNPECCNPFHLDAVPQAENSHRRRDRTATCRRGHAYTPENTSLLKSGQRRCRRCKADHERERKRRIRVIEAGRG